MRSFSAATVVQNSLLSDVSLMTLQQTDSTDPSIEPNPNADAPLQKKYDTLKLSR